MLYICNASRVTFSFFFFYYISLDGFKFEMPTMMMIKTADVFYGLEENVVANLL